MQSIVVSGVGLYAPQRIFKNEDFASIGIETSDEWIRTRTGIGERRLAAEGENVLEMATQAAKKALANSGKRPEEIDLIVVGTFTSTDNMPATACVLGARLGIVATAFDIQAACSGFIYSMSTARALMKANGYKNALIIGAEKLSDYTDWADRTTCVLFGDGAGAAVLSASDEEGVGIVDTEIGADGKLNELLNLTDKRKIAMNGKEVFKHAVTVMASCARNVLERNNLKKEEIKLVIPHQANNRIIKAISDRLDISMDNFFVDVDRYGNTSAASIPIALAEAVEHGKLQKGDWLLLVAFGGGLTWGSALIKWT